MPVLTDEETRRAVILAWDRQRKRYGIFIEAFVIMPEHVHLLVRGEADAVRKFMQYWLSQSSREIRAILERRSATGDAKAAESLQIVIRRGNGPCLGKVWKERFRSIALDREDAVAVKLNYIHNNPVRRGLVDEPKDWRWSSYGSYYGGETELRVDVAFCCGN